MARIKKEQIKGGGLQSFIVRFYWLVIILVFLAAIFVEYFLIIKPKLEQTYNCGPLDVKSREGALEEQRIYYEELKVLEKEANEINQAELEKINYVIAEKIYLPDILKQIYLLGEEENVILSAFNYVFDQGALQIDLSFETANYQEIKKYLDKLEKNIRIMDVTNISMAGIGSSLSIKLQSYYFK